MHRHHRFSMSLFCVLILESCFLGNAFYERTISLSTDFVKIIYMKSHNTIIEIHDIRTALFTLWLSLYSSKWCEFDPHHITVTHVDVDFTCGFSNPHIKSLFFPSYWGFFWCGIKSELKRILISSYNSWDIVPGPDRSHWQEKAQAARSAGKSRELSTDPNSHQENRVCEFSFPKKNCRKIVGAIETIKRWSTS